MTRTPVIAANWKMNNRLEETEQFFSSLTLSPAQKAVCEVIVAPSFPYLATAQKFCTESSGITLAAQDIYPEKSGAFTGMVGSEMLHDLGVQVVITGHSERRHIFKESITQVTKKSLFALKEGFKVILCVGETLTERESGDMFDVITEQLETCNALPSLDDVIIAYEPVWAIGTGVTATPDQAQEMHAFIRKLLIEKYNAGDTRILYGGSVKPANVAELMRKEDIDGALVGGASLKADSFIQLI
ncbi:triose-phosphate isomerase [bacterium]|nr:triose-phosphate isomerase [bacterium]